MSNDARALPGLLVIDLTVDVLRAPGAIARAAFAERRPPRSTGR